MAAFTFIQSASAISTGSLAFASNNTAGSMIVAVWAQFNNSLPTAISDTQGNTYTSFIYTEQTGAKYQVWIARAIAAGANTVSFTGGSTSNNDIILVEYGVPSDFLIVKNGVLPTNNTSSVTASFPEVLVGSPTLPAEVMIIVSLYDYGNFRTWSMTNGTVREQTHESDGATLMLGDYDMVSPTGIVSTVVTNANSGDPWLGVVIALVDLSGGGGGGGSAGGAYTFVG